MGATVCLERKVTKGGRPRGCPPSIEVSEGPYFTRPTSFMTFSTRTVSFFRNASNSALPR